VLPLRTRGGAISVAAIAINERVVNMNLNPIEWDDGLDRAAGTTLFESEDTQHFRVLQLRVDIGHVAIDKADRLTHALGGTLRDRSDELKTEWGRLSTKSS
jgi:hypothetical protein